MAKSDPQDIGAIFGGVLQRHRARAGLSQEDLAFGADVDRTFVSRLERGIRQPVRCPSCRAERRAERNAALISNYEAVRDATTWTEHQASSAGYGLTVGAPKQQRGPRQTYRATCSSCGKPTELPFQPRGGRPVYCRECFNARRGR